MPPAERPLRVFYCPDYTESNPYQVGLMSGVEPEGIRVIPVEAEGVVPLLAAWRRHGRPDVVHLHWLHRFIDTDRRFATVLTAILAIRTLLEVLVLRLAGTPVVWTVHNVISHERKTPRIERCYRHVAARTVNTMIVHCEAARPIVLDRYGLPDRMADRIVVVPHGNYDPFYPTSTPQAIARSELDLPEGEPILLYFGLIRPYKRVPELIETFRAFAPTTGHLLIVGNPWNQRMRDEVEGAAEGAERVHTVLEYVPDDAVPTYLAAADALVLPYDSILTSGSAVLGMTFGRAVIAPDSGCLPSLVGEFGGFIFDPDSDSALESSLAAALSDRDRLQSMGDRNRRVADTLDWADIGSRTATVYRALAGSSSTV